MIDVRIPSRRNPDLLQYKRASYGAIPQGHIRIKTKLDLADLHLWILVGLHNAFTVGLPVDRFVDRTDAVDKTWAALREHCPNANPEDEKTMANAATRNAAQTGEGSQATAKKMAQADKDAAKAAKATERANAKAQRDADKAAKAAQRRQPGQETEVVSEALRMLRRKNGATKKQLVEALGEKHGTKEGYVSALLTRILGEKGYELTSEAIEGSREKTYHVAADKGPDIDFKNRKNAA